MKVHIFDAISRDQRVIRATEDEIELEYVNLDESDSDDPYGRKKKRSVENTQGREMIIHLFGMTAEGESVRVDVTGFRPFFYVAVPPEVDWQSISKKLSTKVKQDFNQIDFKLEHKQKLYGYSGNKKCAFVRISMPSLGMFYTVRKEFLDDKQNPKFVLNARGKPLEVFESNIDPMLRFFHMRDIKPCGWVEVDGDETEANAEEDISLRCKWQNVSPAESSAVTAPLLHAFWDIECYSHTGEFPQANPEKKVCLSSPQPCRNCSHCFLNAQGDPIIQIGTTLWSPACGDKPEFTERHIFVLAENSGKTRSGCAAVPNARVYVCKKEADLLISWFQFIVERKVNVFVGYNIFGFDEKYVWQRLERLNCDQNEEVQQFSHLYNEGKPMKLIEKRLSSSALGDNMLYMWDTPGRLRIDLLGHIKRKAQLPSYKLDSVAAVYLSGKLSGVSPLEKGQWLIKTKDKKDARVGRYVQLLDDLGEDLTDKMEIMELVPEGFVVRSDECLSAIAGAAARWAVVKDDVSPQDIFRLHRGSDEDRAKVAAYCVQDCDLTLELYKKLDVFNEAMSMANVCSVPVSYIFTRGQGIKIESLIFKDCMKTGQLIKVLPSGETNVDSYEGAIVLDPTPGFYTDSPVGVCDFASLYPSTIISENISHDMLVWAKDYDLQGRLVCVSYGAVEDEVNAIPGTQWTDIEFDIMRPDPEDGRKHPTKLKAGTRHCRYAQPPGDKKGSLPQIVAKLLAARKAKRVEITKTDDPFKKALLDAEQNAYKITANSLYGQLGSPTFKIRLQNLAASVTAYGRKQIMFSKEAIERFYGPEAGDPRCKAGAQVVYGDSVTGDTPLYVMHDGASPHLKRIDELVSWDSASVEPWHGTKETVELHGVRIWTDKGWTAVRRIIRHKLAPTKKLFRILTHSGVVDCTEDHSLVNELGVEIKPSDVAVGSTLLHNFDVAKEFGDAASASAEAEAEAEAWVMGLFLADGSADVYQCPSGQKSTWAINKADTALLEKAAAALPFDTKILDTIESSGVYKLVARGNVKVQATKYRELFYNAAREKRVPPSILNAPLNIVQAFLNGFYAGDGDKEVDMTRWDQKGKEVCTGLYILASRLGYKVSFNDRAGKQDVFRSTITKGSQRKNLIAIKRIRELPWTDDYVYDLETENHHFAVGPGALVVHNTDSIFVSFNPQDPVTGRRLEGREAIVATQELTEEVGKFITGALKAPHDFEYDKTFSPFIIFSKKRYVGNKYEESPDDFKETSMGIVLKRRDNAPLLKMTYGSAIDRLLNHRDVVGAVEVVKKNVMELVQGKMKLSQLTITKSLRSEYKCTPPAHKILAQRIAARDPGNAPASGERIGYVYVQAMPGQEASKLQGDRVETPEFIVANGLKPDAEYYILHQLYNPLAQLFGLMVEKMPGFVAPVWAKDVDKLIGQREALAGELLFQEGLTACKNLAKRDFVGKFFGLRPEGLRPKEVRPEGLRPTGLRLESPLGQQPEGTRPENLLPESPIAQKPQGRRTPPADPTLAAASAAAFGSGSGSAAKVPTFKQPALQFTPFQKDTAVWVDDMMAKKMRSKPKKKETTN